MAGLRLSLRDVQYFKHRTVVEVELLHQALDGHPAVMSVENTFGIQMPSSSWDIVQRGETNAEGRARQGPSKIKGSDKYKGELPGKLKLSVSYNSGCLTVYLDSAKDLFGKRSQDAYAWVYLLDKEGRCFFQAGNEKTKTFDKNLNPDFKHEFNFRMSLADINTKSLVVAIWDEDSSSRDDYMAGLRLSLRDVQYFKHRTVVEVELLHQALDGHPAVMSVENTFGIQMPSSSWDLPTCNNHLVAFIDRARVLAEAYEIKGSLPSTLQERTSLMPPDASRLFEEEILRLKRVISMGRSKLAEKRRERDSLKTENDHLKATFTKNQYALKEAQSTLFGLEVRESELSAKVIGLDHLREQIRILEMRITAERQRIDQGRSSYQDIGHVHEEALYIPSLGGINMGQSKYEQEKKKIEIRIRNEFLLRMKLALEKARQSYQLKYQEFILKIERDADEIMRLYEDIIRERTLKGVDKKNMLLDLERSRAYQLRINQLLGDIRDFDSRIGSLEGRLGGLDADYRNKLGLLDADLDALKRKLKDLFAMFSAFAQSRYNETNEISIYNNLLGFEEGRLADNVHKVQRKVTVSESVVRASHAADVSLGSGVSAAFGHGYSVKSGSGGYRRESGYSSRAQTPSSVHGGGMEVFDFGDLTGNGEQTITKTTTRSSRYSSGHSDHGLTGMTGTSGMTMTTTRSSRSSGDTNVFESIKGDIL